jgi:hypothetical protein
MPCRSPVSHRSVSPSLIWGHFWFHVLTKLGSTGQNAKMNTEDAPLLDINELVPVDLEALEAALALLDDCDPCSPIDSSGEVSTSLSLDASRELHAGGATSNDGGATIGSSSSKRSHKRVREYSPELERLRRQRKRLERQELAWQAQQLEQQLAAMKERGWGLHVGSTGAETILNAAAERRRSRVQAEELNRQLREALAAHVDVSKCVSRLLSLLSKTTEEVGEREPCIVLFCSQLLTMPNCSAIHFRR